MEVVKRPVLKDAVLVGAGHAHVAVLRMFAMKPLPGVRLTLISREVHTPYSGMLPGLVAGLYDFDEAHIDTGPLARFAGARLYQDEVVGIDLAARRLLCRSRPPVPYDLLSLNIGATPDVDGVPGAAENAVPVKPIDGFLGRFEELRARVIERNGRARIALVGAGAGGVELMLAVERRLRRAVAEAGFDAAAMSFVLVSGAPDILPTFPAAFRARFRAVLAARGIAVIAGAPVIRVEQKRLVFDGHPAVEADEILWTTQAAPARWLAGTGLTLDRRGFLVVEDTLQAPGHSEIFAAGDTIAFSPRALPKSGVYAVRAGPVLADNIRRALTGRPLRRFRPQRDALYLVSTGERFAVGTRNGFTFAGAWVWRWKDWIDRRFMARYNALPDMAKPATEASSPLADRQALKEISAIAMRCGGCGAKVGATVLSRALGAIEPASRPDIVAGLDAPDDAALVDTGGEKLSVQTVDYFRAIIDDPYTFGRIAANHALGDIYAMGGEPQSALAIATIPYGLEAKVEADLSSMMAGANEVLRQAGCALVGGHTSEGAELALGFSVNGLVERDAALRKGGLRPGSALILTKPIGTGTLLAADMRGKAKARWVMATVAHMTRSNQAAAAILKGHGVHGATDVTGFGLLGHLVEMVRASDVDVTLAIDRVPLIDGARDTVALGILSSLQPQNLRLRRAIRNLDAASRHPLYPLLFDPQTAGGLLAAVPLGRAEACVVALRAAGYRDAAVIGTVDARSEALEPIAIDLTGAEIAEALAAVSSSGTEVQARGEKGLAKEAERVSRSESWGERP
ncbi:MAG: selenide, water dikinase SelD [Alphaproteobacteria bacterium]|nr:selenide, water dikinase SelD [Alphaproteobacteria bacterium]